MWQIPQHHPFAKIKVRSRIRLIALATALVAHNWKVLLHHDNVNRPNWAGK